MNPKVSKVVEGIEFELVNEVLHRENGVLVNNSFWIEKGSTDNNDDGVISNITLICVVPEGCKNIDLSKLDEACLTKSGSKLLVDVNINEEAKIKE